MNNKVKCELCGSYFKGLAGHLSAKHNISTSEYKVRFPNSLTLSKEFYLNLELEKQNNIRKCENCENTFNFSKNKRKRFCSSYCRYRFISNKRIGLKISKNYILQKCYSCGSEKEVLSYNDNKYFCDKNCYNKYHRVLKTFVKCKFSECDNLIENSDKENKKYCSRNCYSMDYNEDRINFNTNCNYKKGYYVSIRDNSKKWFDSFYELSRMKQLDMDKNVKEWSKNRIKIKYIGEDGREHIYTPDLLVKYENGTSIVEEIKGRMTTRDVLKMEAAIPFLKKMNIEYKIIQKNDIYDDYIEPIIEDYENKFGTFQRISLLYSFMKMTNNLSNRSTCIRRQVGCIIVPNTLENIYSIGYNGSLSGEENGCKEMGSGKCGCIHAEINALNKLGNIDSDNLLLLCTLSPCLNCSKEILKYPIKRVIYLNSYRDTYGIKFLRENNIEVLKYLDLVKESNDKYIKKI
jgi:dCMP deaminase